MGYDIIKKILQYNNPGTSITPIGGIIHETANPGDSAESEYEYFNSADRQASAHAFVDDKSIIQTIEWTNKAWHAGQTANNSYIGIELCHTTDPDKFNEIWNRGVWLWAYVFVNVLKITNVTKDNLMSHAEASAKWRETDHQDPISYFATFGKTVDDFRYAVQQEINSMITPPKPVRPFPNSADWKYDGVKFLQDSGLTNDLHDPEEKLDMGTLGVILKKLKLK